MNNTCEFTCMGAQCPNHCCGAYHAVSPVFKALGNIKFSEIILLPQDMKRLRDAGLDHLIQEEKDGIPQIKTTPDGTCSALKNGKCSIYENRPSICRAYPLYLDMYVGACALTECPAVPENMKPTDNPEALSCLLDIYQFWIDYYRKNLPVE